MIARDRFAVELCGHQRVIVERIFDPHIGGVAVVATEKNVTHFRFRFHNFRQCKESNPAPATIEFAPSGDAVEIGDVLELGEGVELLPGKRFRVLDRATDLEAPIGESDFRFDPEIEDGKALGEMLARREAISRARADRRTPGGTFFRRHFACPTFLALDQRKVAHTSPYLKLRKGSSFRRGAETSTRGARAPHFAGPTFLALDQTRVGRCHDGKLTADYSDCADKKL